MEEVSYVTTDTSKLTEGGESLGESEMGNEIPEEGPLRAKGKSHILHEVCSYMREYPAIVKTR